MNEIYISIKQIKKKTGSYRLKFCLSDVKQNTGVFSFCKGLILVLPPLPYLLPCTMHQLSKRRQLHFPHAHKYDKSDCLDIVLVAEIKESHGVEPKESHLLRNCSNYSFI